MEEKKDQNRNNHRKTLLILAIAVALAVVVAIILSSQSSVRLNKLLKDGENYLDSENYEAAEYSFESALTIDPNNDKAKTKLADTYTAWAKALSDGKDYEQAVMVLDRASDTFGKDDEITSVVKETYTNWVDNLEDDGNQLLAAQITKRAGKNGVTLESSTAETDVQEPDTDNPAQLNTKKSNTQKTITDLSNTHSFFPSAAPAADGLTDGFDKRAEIKEQIEYDCICQQHDRMQLDELVEIMLEVAMNRSPTIKIGRDAEYPTGFVQQRFEKITSMHIEKVMDGIRENTTRVWNTKAYLLSALFNSVSTTRNHYAMLVNHDMYGKEGYCRLAPEESH